jgi:guanylate kinase
MNKTIVIGASLSGKTTIIKYLRANTKLTISEIDEELTGLNNGIYPMDIEYKHKVLFPQILEKILKESSIIFFTNTSYFSIQELREAREKGFTIIQLEVSLEVLKQRNIERQNEGYDNLEQYLEGMVEYQEILKKENLVDYIVNAEQTVENVISELLEIFKK